MTFHELSHLRGFEEGDATTFQLMLDESRLGAKVILFYNREYRDTRQLLSRINDDAVKAFRTLMEREPKAQINACQYLSNAFERIHDFFVVGQTLPVYLFEKAQVSIIRPVIQAGLRCDETKPTDIIQTLQPALQASANFARDLEQFESPLCQGELCVFRRGFHYNPEEALQEWSGKKRFFMKGAAYPSVKGHKVQCDLESLPDHEKIHLKDVETDHIDLSKVEPQPGILSGLHSLKLNEETDPWNIVNARAVQLSHGGSVQVLDAEGFTANTDSIRVILQPAGRETATVRFAIMDPMVDPRPEQRKTTSLAYFLVSPFSHTLYQTPKILREFRLTCQLRH